MNIPQKKPMSGGQQKPQRPVMPGFKPQFNTGFRKSSPNAPVGQTPKPAPKKRDDTSTMKIIDLIVKISIYATIFLLPLFFLSKVPSILELNKQVLMVVVVGVGFLSWVGKMAWKNEIRFKKDFILVPVVTFVAIFGLSTVFSNYTEQSLWGYFGGEAKSFVTTLFLAALFFLIINNIKTKKEAVRIVIVFLASGFLVSLYGILQIWELYALPTEVSKNPFFNTVGSVYIFGSYVAALFLLTQTLFLGDVSKILKIVLIALSFFFFFVLMVVNFKVVWIALILCMAVLFGVTILRGGTTKNQSRILPMVFLVLTLLMVLRKQPIVRKDLPIEVLLSYKSSTSIALNSFKSNPLLGSGPTTYTTVFQDARPDNLGDFWAVNFNDGTSYFITLVSTMGILGTLAFLFLVGSGLVYLFKTILRLVSADRKDTGDYIAAGAGIVWLFSTIILFTYLTNITFLMLWWFSLSLFLSFSFFEKGDDSNEFVTTSDSPKSSLVLSFVFVLVIIGFVAAMYLQSQKYLAATHFNKALVLDATGEEIEEVVEELSKAIELDPNRDIYHRNLSVALFALANKRVAEKGQDLTPDDSNYVSGMIRGALTSAGSAVAIDPNNSENHLTLARVYEGVLITMDEADEKAVESYQEAIMLDPKNPILHHRVANIYVTLADVELGQARNEGRVQGDELPEESLKNLALARESLDASLALKADYAAANLLLAGVYEREGDIERAIDKEKDTKAKFPNAPGIPFRLGLLYYKSDQFDNAKREFESAIALDKNYANARYFLGLVLDGQGQKQEALEQFVMVAELNPENQDLKKIITNLKNGDDALDGLEGGSAKSPVETNPNQPGGQQPGISPGVENQEIPESATPTVDELNDELPPEEQVPPGEGPRP